MKQVAIVAAIVGVLAAGFLHGQSASRGTTAVPCMFSDNGALPLLLPKQ